jgi:hypothetical protein
MRGRISSFLFLLLRGEALHNTKTKSKTYHYALKGEGDELGSCFKDSVAYLVTPVRKENILFFSVCSVFSVVRFF